ncbi:GDSL esterase/lipase At5g55050-like [Rutidosis leptorrhynchoides]|uniref:GDSL esterase/lipase At5g55050-like n=1 Tax=Rutidosis leptorrhynchoides TaxID=125765 RepID=UPI003A99268E
MTRNYLLFIFLVLVVASSPSSCRAGTPAVFIFGDSLLDIGTNNYVLKTVAKSKYPHYGVDFFNSTPSGRFSNGLNMADFMARVAFGETVTSPPAFLSLFSHGKYAESRLQKAINFQRSRRRWRHPFHAFNSSSVQIKENPAVGINFASSGTAILDINTAVDQAVPITEQMTQLQFVHGNLTATIGSWKTQLLFAKSTFFIGVGNNDVHFFALARAKLDPNKYIDLLVETYNKTLTLMYNLGARKFGVVSIPYLGCSPLMRVTIIGGNCSKTANDLAEQLNDKLEQLLWNMTIHSKGMMYSFANTYDILHDFWDNPQRYNFTNVVDACCGLGRFNAMTNCHPVAKLCDNRDEYLFWDVSHPSERATRIMVDMVTFGGLNYARPINWAKLVRL